MRGILLFLYIYLCVTLAVGPSYDVDSAVAPSSSSSVQDPSVDASSAAPPAPVPDLLGDLLDLGEPIEVPAPAMNAGAAAVGTLDLLDALDINTTTTAPGAMGGTPPPPQPQHDATVLPLVLAADKGKGLGIRGSLSRINNTPTYTMTFENVSAAQPLDGFMIQLNKNTFGLSPADQVIALSPHAPIAQGQRATAIVPLVANAFNAVPAVSSTLQVAVKCAQLGVLYFEDVIPLAAVLEENSKIESTAFVSSWKNVPESDEAQRELPSHVIIRDASLATAALEAVNLFVMAHKSIGSEQVLYVTGRVHVHGGVAVQLLMELRFVEGHAGVKAFLRSERKELADAVFAALAQTLS